MEPTEFEVLEPVTIVERALALAMARFDQFPELCGRLSKAAILSRPGVKWGVSFTVGDAGCVVEYDPDYIHQLMRDHRYPTWVVCASLERLILKQAEEIAGEGEREKFVAHRERARGRAPRGSGAPPSPASPE